MSVQINSGPTNVHAGGTFAVRNGDMVFAEHASFAGVAIWDQWHQIPLADLPWEQVSPQQMRAVSATVLPQTTIDATITVPRPGYVEFRVQFEVGTAYPYHEFRLSVACAKDFVTWQSPNQDGTVADEETPSGRYLYCGIPQYKQLRLFTRENVKVVCGQEGLNTRTHEVPLWERLAFYEQNEQNEQNEQRFIAWLVTNPDRHVNAEGSTVTICGYIAFNEEPAPPPITYRGQSITDLTPLLRCPICHEHVQQEDNGDRRALCCNNNHRYGFYRDLVPDFGKLDQEYTFTDDADLRRLNTDWERTYRFNWRTRYNGERITQIDDALPKSGHILDIGAGDGQISAYYQRQGDQQNGRTIVAFDRSPIGIDLAEEADVSFVLGEAYHLPFWDNTFDAVVCAEVLEHLLMPYDLLHEIHRVLKPGGVIVGSVPNHYFLPFRLNMLRGQWAEFGDPLAHEHIRFYSKHVLQTALARTGFSKIEINGLWPDGLYEESRLFRYAKRLRALVQDQHSLFELLSLTFMFQARRP